MNVNNKVVHIRDEPATVTVPRALFAVWKQFELDSLCGNVQLNCKDGRLLGFRVETVHTCK